MAKGNILKQKDEPQEKEEKKKGEKKVSSFASFLEKIDRRKTKSITGLVLLLLSIYLFIAFISYLFSWKTDQDLILSTSASEFLFSNPDIEVANWLGKLGAWSAHVFMYKWFGLPSFAFCFLFFITGVRLLLNIRLFPLRRTYIISAIAIIWTSSALGLVSSNINFLGGTFGYGTKIWLSSIFGLLGAILLLLVTFAIIMVVLFNPDFKALFQRLFNRNNDVEEDTDDDTVGNTLIEDEFMEDDISEDETDEDEEEDEDFEVVFKDNTLPNEEEDEDEDLEEDETEETLPQPIDINDFDDEEFSVEIAENEKELSENDLNEMVDNFGPFDPTLELSNYVLPPIDLLKKFESNHSGVTKEELEENKNKIVETLSNYKIEIAKIKATIGPTVTLYEIVPAPGVRISKIKNLEDDIALSLSALGIRIIAPIPGKGTIGIEVPNSSPEMVSMRSLIASEKFQNAKFELPIVLGKTITNETYAFDLAKTPHLLVAGATGQGKSVGLNAILVSLLYKKHPSQLKFVLVDPKKVELTLYNKIERHFLAKLPDSDEAIITDTSKVVNTLNSLCIEMDERYGLLKEAQTRNIIEYNEKFIARKLNPNHGHHYLPYIVVVIDEFADLIMTAGKEVEHPIARLAQLARAIGIHLIVATQRPSVNVITGMIKANFPARIAFRVLSKIDSRTILDSAGADQLIGKGDMLISTGNDMIRLQCGFVDTPEVEDICNFIGDQRGYPSALLLPEYTGGEEGEGSDYDPEDGVDDKFVEAAQIVVIHQQGSASLLQRKLKLGYNRAGRLIDQLESHGVVGPFRGSKARDVQFGNIEGLNEYLREKGLLDD
ncbi:MAG: DNA translocase FtsK 4TM domain-containing protein [Brumimicrobium sp.]|nr:DNA translocase FtsK 4TM domain-containing protein [Brumimicrobium sp.]